MTELSPTAPPGPIFTKDALQKFIMKLLEYYPGLTELKGLLRDEFASVPFENIDSDWVTYSKNISQAHFDPGSQITSHDIGMSQGEHLDEVTVSSYLHLIKSEPLPYATIHPIQEASAEVVLSGSGTAIIPFRVDSQIPRWAFAVMHADIAHWYGDKPSSGFPSFYRSIERIGVESSWTGPKVRSAMDTGVSMLIGIRLAYNGLPHISQDKADILIPMFRSRMLVELKTKSLEPQPEDFRTIQEELGLQDNAYFNDAWMTVANGLSPVPSPSHISRSSSEGDFMAFSVPLSVNSGDELNPTNGAIRSATPSSQRQLISDRKSILYLLSDAVSMMRAKRILKKSTLGELWLNLNTDSSLSVFHKRYLRLLFAQKWTESDSNFDDLDLKTKRKMKKAAKSFLFWKEIFDIEYWNSYRYVLLCAVPAEVSEADSSRDNCIRTLKESLSYGGGELTENLKMAEELCQAIVEEAIPEEFLLIDSYRFRKCEPLHEGMYEAYLSLNRASAPRIAIAKQR